MASNIHMTQQEKINAISELKRRWESSEDWESRDTWETKFMEKITEDYLSELMSSEEKDK